MYFSSKWLAVVYVHTIHIHFVYTACAMLWNTAKDFASIDHIIEIYLHVYIAMSYFNNQ